MPVPCVTSALVNQSVEDCLISDYEEIIPTLQLPDPDDRHVLAVAIVGQADLIITLDLDDFPPEVGRKGPPTFWHLGNVGGLNGMERSP